MRRSLRMAGIAFFASLFLCSGAVLFWKIHDQRQSAASFQYISQLVYLPDQSVGNQQRPAAPEEVYARVAVQNPDFAGWISIEGTEINYPVMRNGETPDFYLQHGFNRAYSSHGVPFLAAGCEPGVSDNILIYGHNMRDGTMFSPLCGYTDREFYQEHKIICFDTLECFGKYEVIAAFTTSVSSDDGFLYHNFIQAQDETTFNAYISRCKELAMYDTGLSAKYGDELLTLSTCEYSQPDGRMVVVARRLV